MAYGRERTRPGRGGENLTLLALVALAVLLLGKTCSILGPRERAEVRAEPARPAPAPPRVPPPHFPRVALSDSVVISADVHQPVEELLSFAQSALRTHRAWLGADTDPVPAKRYRIFLCRALETMRRLEELNGLPRSDPEPVRSFEFRGGFYPGLDMVLLQCRADEDVRPKIAHELAHAVFREIVGQGCDALDEGLATYAEARLVPRGQGTQGLKAVADAVEQGSLPSLRRFFALDYWEFRDQRAEWRNFTLSWLLVRLLMEDGSPELAGRFPRLLAALAGANPWLALQRTYDVELLEEAWKREAEATSRWFPAWGEWELADESFEVTLRRPGVAVLARRERPLLHQPFTIRVRAVELEPESDLGFVVGLTDPDHYVALTLRPGAGGLIVGRCEGERWAPSQRVPVADLPRDWRAEDLELACDEKGEVRLSHGSRLLVRHLLGGEAFRGRIGLYVEPRDTGSDERRARFERLQVTWSPAQEGPVTPIPESAR